MTKHIKPSNEELAAKEVELAAELEIMAKEDEDPTTPEEPQEEETPVEEEEEVVEEEAEEETEEEKPEVKQVKKEEEAEEKPDVKERYKESTREAQILHSKNKKYSDAFKKVKNIVEPTEEELKTAYPEWDDYTDLERKLLTKDLKNDRRFEAINEIGAEAEDADAWGEKVDKFIDDPQVLIDNPKLEGKVSNFTEFANKPSRRGVDMDDLIKAYLYDVSEAKPAKKKGNMFPTGTSGVDKNIKPKSDKMTVEQGAALQKRDYQAYIRAVKADKIEQL